MNTDDVEAMRLKLFPESRVEHIPGPPAGQAIIETVDETTYSDTRRITTVVHTDQERWIVRHHCCGRECTLWAETDAVLHALNHDRRHHRAVHG